ncbi:hypothetical protein C8Q74DRAFT_1215186 [Fomes fomentarius]|nr:hypothetical protein C8Q74DRAFT_1215186 [Fomes fomentarius]
MSLDQGLFSLNVTQRPDDRNIVDLIDSKGVPQYTKRRLPGTEYTIELYDSLSEGLLATVTAPNATSKHKTLQLHNPDSIVELKYTGTITFKWGFKWEEHEFEWKREECYIIRKPDPAVLIASTKEPPGKLQTRAVQLLYYNINRFDIHDLKGLEIVILTALLTFSDLNETYHGPATIPPAGAASTSAPSAPNGPPPALPPKPEPRKGVDRVAEMHAVCAAQGEGEANEIMVWEECDIDDYAQYAERLLNDEAMLFVSIRSASAAQVPKVLRVVEETKRLRHKSGIEQDEELHQYVIYDTDKSTQRKGPRRINLDDPDPKKGAGKDKEKYAPPSSLTVHLSKIDMPELRPRALANSRRPSETGVGRASPPPPGPSQPNLQELSAKERKRLEKESRKAGKGKKVDKEKDKEKLYNPAPPTGPPPRPSSSSEPFNRYHHPAHQPHPHQPSPSPSQLNNPAIYAAPPPYAPRPPHTPQPQPQPPQNTRPRPVSMAFPSPQGSSTPTSFYGSGPAPGYSARPPPPPPIGPTSPTAGPGSGYRPGYLAAQESGAGAGGRPTSFFGGGSGGKGPVSALLDMWSKH